MLFAVCDCVVVVVLSSVVCLLCLFGENFRPGVYLIPRGRLFMAAPLREGSCGCCVASQLARYAHTKHTTPAHRRHKTQHPTLEVLGWLSPLSIYLFG